MPPSGTVSMCEPVRTTGASELTRSTPRAPKTLPAGSTRLAEQPRARLLVRRAPAHARHAAAGQRAEAREGEQAIFQTGQRHGQHDPGVYRLDFVAGPSLE